MPRFPGLTAPARLSLATAVTLPAIAARLGGSHLAPLAALLVFGTAVVGASFLLAWSAEAAEIDVSGGLTIAALAVVAVLPEYAVDLYFAWVSGHAPAYAAYATANMTGSNRLLLGLGWPVVVFASIGWGLTLRRKPRQRRSETATDHRLRALALDGHNRTEVAFLALAGILALALPILGSIPLALGLVMLALFAWYLVTVARAPTEEPELIGTPARLAALPRRRRRLTVGALFVLAAGVTLLCAEPFAHALLDTGSTYGINRFLLVQWLGPLASEAPEFTIAIIFAARGRGTAALATLLSSKVNQWTMLIGSLPLAHLVGGGAGALPLDPRQVEEVLLTATQTMLGVTLLLGMSLSRRAAWALLGLFAVQFVLPGEHARLLLSAVYAALAAVLLVVHRRQVRPTIRSLFPEQRPTVRAPTLKR